MNNIIRTGLLGLMVILGLVLPTLNVTVVPPTAANSAQIGVSADTQVGYAWDNWLCSPQGVLKKPSDFPDKKTGEQDYYAYEASSGSKEIPKGSKCTMWSPTVGPTAKPTSPPMPTTAPTNAPTSAPTNTPECIVTDIKGTITHPQGDHRTTIPIHVHVENKSGNPDCLSTLWIDVFGSFLTPGPNGQVDGWLESQKNNFVLQKPISVPAGSSQDFDFTVEGGAQFCWEQVDMVRTKWLPGKDEIPAYNGDNMADFVYVQGKGCQPTSVPTSTSTTVPTATPTIKPTNTSTPAPPTNTPTPTATATATAATGSPTATNTPAPPTATLPPVTPVPATNTPVPVSVPVPSATPVPPTAVPSPPTTGPPSGPRYSLFCEWLSGQQTWTLRNVTGRGGISELPHSGGRDVNNPFGDFQPDNPDVGECVSLAPTPTATPVPPTATRIPPPTATATATPSPTPTAVSTDTPSPTATATATVTSVPPTATATPELRTPEVPVQLPALVVTTALTDDDSESPMEDAGP